MTLTTIVFLGIGALIVAAYGIAQLEFKAAERERHFECLFNKAQSILELEPTERWMKEMVIIVSELEKWSNKEKVDFIKTKFFTDYKKLSDELLSENEYSVEETFRKN
jgi:hypothetical protein